MKKKITIFLLAILVILGLTSSNAQALLYEIEKDWTLYGSLNQNTIPDIGSMACGPTAAVNSFVYLQNKYPNIYDKKLVPDTNGNNIIDQAEMISVAQTLSGANYMNMDMVNGTFADNFIYGKWKYLEEVAPQSTIYHAQNNWDWIRPPVDQFDWVTQVVPTWDFLYNELLDCEDVEILINGDYNHYLTLTSFYWDDLNNDGIIDSSEDAWIDYIDPWTGAWGISDIWHSAGQIETNYGNGISWISMSVAESPVPEPATMLLVGSGLIGLAGLRRKLRKT
jgi:hypothetical protein